jgi:protein ImuB
VVQGILQTDPLPEQACRWTPMTGTLRTYSKRSKSLSQTTQAKGTKPPPAASYQTRWRAEPQETQPLRRPIQLLPMPLPLTTSPPTSQELPHTFQLGHHPARNVHQARGPERIETGWWEGDSIQRDYYRIELDSGDWWWVYLDRRNHTWYLHGYFS